MTDILTPQLRAIDGINRWIRRSVKRRWPASQPSAPDRAVRNVLGGTFTAIKTVGKRVDKMIVKRKSR